jgi:hypothetical protein
MKKWTAGAIADVTKDMLQGVWQDVNCRWSVCRATDDAQCSQRTSFSLLCKQPVSVYEENTANNIFISVFIPML